MDIDGYVDSRLERWASWLWGQNKIATAPWARMRFGMPSPTASEIGERPMINTEAMETDQIIKVLPFKLRAAVHACYPRSEPTKTAIAGRLGISRSALDYRLIKARGRIWTLLERRKNGEQEKARTAAISVPGARRTGRGRTIASIAPR